MALRRGFKTEANATSRELRAELALESTAPICPFRLADHLDVELIKLSTFLADHPKAASYLLGEGKSEFFAATLCGVTPRRVIYNDAHSPARTAADIAHELAHMLLLHPAHRLTNETGGRHFDKELEDEANWLGPAILVSEEAAISIVRRGWPPGQAATHFGVSEELMRMRLGVTGAYNRVRRAA